MTENDSSVHSYATLRTRLNTVHNDEGWQREKATLSYQDAQQWVELLYPVPENEADKGVLSYQDVFADIEQKKFGYSLYRDDLLQEIAHGLDAFDPTMHLKKSSMKDKEYEQTLWNEALDVSLDKEQTTLQLLQIGALKLLNIENADKLEMFSQVAGFDSVEQAKEAAEALSMLARQKRIAPPQIALQELKKDGQLMTGTAADLQAVSFTPSSFPTLHLN